MALKVLHTESSMNMGGQELRILAEMEGLRSRGIVSVLAARPGSGIIREARARGLKAYAINMRGSFDPFAVAAFIRMMLREKVDVVNAHGSKDGWSAGTAARILGIRVIRSRHVANPIRAHFFGRLAYTALCDRIVTTGESIKQAMAERGVPAGKITSVPTGVDTKRFHPGVEKGALRKELGVPEGAPLVGMVSVLRGDKGPDVFLKAAEAVLDRRRDVFFALVGDGWMRGRLEEYLSKSRHNRNIFMTGYRRDIPEVMADLDVLALPAKAAEGVPQVILQAHAMKVPVAASDVGGITEVAVDGKTALTTPPGDHGALADAMLRLIEDKTLAARLAEEGHRLVTERYTLEGMLDRMEAVYKSDAP